MEKLLRFRFWEEILVLPIYITEVFGQNSSDRHGIPVISLREIFWCTSSPPTDDSSRVDSIDGNMHMDYSSYIDFKYFFARHLRVDTVSSNR